MGRFLLLGSLLWLGPVALLAQSREETMNYIVSEFKSLDSKTYTGREIAFSSSGDSFTFRRNRLGKPEKGTTFQLAKVDVYCVTLHRPRGIDRFRLMVRSRGKDGIFLANGVNFQGELPLASYCDNERKMRALEKAFLRLTTLVTGRKELFPVF